MIKLEKDIRAKAFQEQTLIFVKDKESREQANQRSKEQPKSYA